MARFFTNRCCTILLLALNTGAIGWAATAPGNATARSLGAELSYDDLAYQRGKVVMHKVIITEKDLNRKVTMQVQADLAEATGIDFEESNWNFNGKVVVTLPEGELHAEHAIVAFNRGRIAMATVDGTPATFAQRSAPDEATRAGTVSGARGRATQISYDVASGDVRLTGDASLSDDSGEINSQRIVYSIPQRMVRADSESASGERVRGTIKPRSKAAGSGATAPVETTP